MKKISILVAVYVLSLAGVAFAQKHTQHISFDDGVGPGNAGTYSPTDHFGVDLYVTYSGYNSTGYDIWLETTANAAPHISLTDFAWAGSPFDKPIQDVSFPLGFTLLQSNGLYTTPNPSDLGNGISVVDAAHVVPPGTYLAGHLSVSLTGFAPGVYVLQSSATSPHGSQVTSFDGTTFADNFMPVTTYTITIVPEPSTFALVMVLAIGVGAWMCQRTLSKRPYS